MLPKNTAGEGHSAAGWSIGADCRSSLSFRQWADAKCTMLSTYNATLNCKPTAVLVCL